MKSMAENVEETKEVEMESDDSEEDNEQEDMDDNASDDQEDEENLQKVDQLQQQLQQSPYLYDAHVELIKLLRQMGDLDKLRDAREKMSELFPLTEELWLDWLRDEIPLATDESERRKVDQLFERAVKDYLSVDVWLEYVQYSIGGMGQQDGVAHIRDVFERALSTAGLHVERGSTLWEAYREFENAILAGLMPQPGQVPTEQQQEEFKSQNNRVISLFKRQFSVPLYGMEEAYAEYKEYIQDEIDSFIKQTYEKSQKKLEKLQAYEDALSNAELPRLEEYQSYIQYELSQDDPARIQCIYERAIQENCLNSDLWLQYGKYLDRKLQIKPIVTAMYERAVRNCPWCSQLWQNYILAMERFDEPQEKIKNLVDKALQCGFNHGSDYLVVWSTYCDYLRRRIKWGEDHMNELDLFRKNIENAVEHISMQGPDADPNGSLRQYWAIIEGKHCKDMTKSREIWNSILSEGHGNEAAMWLEYYKLERTCGDNKHCRKLLQRALNSVTDWPETIVDAYINFEREEGTLEQYDQAMEKCDAQMARINERRQKAEEKEMEMKGQKKKVRTDKKIQKKGEQKKTDQGRFSQQTKQKQKYSQKQNSWSDKKEQTSKQQQQTEQEKVSKDMPQDDKMDSEKGKADSFKVPPPPGSKGPPPPGFKGPPPPGFKGPPPPGTKGPPPPGFKGPPPPGYKGKSDAEEGPPAKKQKIDGEREEAITGDGDRAEEDPDKMARTAFVSNLDFNLEEDRIGQIFSECGEMTDIRLIRTIKGKSKGYAYIEFRDELCVQKALSMDRKPIEGRPIYVSKCEDKRKQKSQFKFSTDLEKNKLFIKNLPFTCSKEALQQIFGQHGALKDVRLVTYRSGAPKGLAYVEYENQQDAAKAVVQTDGLKVGDHEISVAISNPPGRKIPLAQRDEPSFTPTLGGGKKESEYRGKARTQVSMVPRVVQRTPATGANVRKSTNQTPASNNATANGQDTDQKKSDSKMSNDDFRKMLLK